MQVWPHLHSCQKGITQSSHHLPFSLIFSQHLAYYLERLVSKCCTKKIRSSRHLWCLAPPPCWAAARCWQWRLCGRCRRWSLAPYWAGTWPQYHRYIYRYRYKITLSTLDLKDYLYKYGTVATQVVYMAKILSLIPIRYRYPSILYTGKQTPGWCYLEGKIWIRGRKQRCKPKRRRKKRKE